MRKSLIDCLMDHNIDDCPGKKTGQLPRRILDLGPVTGQVDENGPVMLKECKEGDKAIYTTLSYCWGDPQYQLITTKSNLRLHLRGWPSAQFLPKTFADAIRVTRHLGVQYLWIDALCIIQDDEMDKLEQIEAMSDIYRNSILTISASLATGVSEGFLSSGKPLKAAAQIPLLISNSIDPKHGLIFLRGDWVPISISDEPLYSRAWTFQEAVLSPRVLDFNTYNSVHMCSDFEYPSIFPGHKVVDYEWPGQEIFKNIHRLESFKFFQLFYRSHPRYAFRDGEFDLDSFGMWRYVVFEYSSRHLSFPEDRLPALAGIAKRLTPFAGTYVAGLWKESIVHHLGWEHKSMQTWPQGGSEADLESDSIRSSHGTSYKARPSPSWSWVSVPYGVFIAPLLTADARLVECHVQLASEKSPYGQVRRATIMLEARIIQFSELRFVQSVTQEPGQVVFEGGRSFRLDFSERMPGRVRLLYLGTRSHYKDTDETELEPVADARTFLVIRKTGGANTYRRIGVFHLREVDAMVKSGKLDTVLDSKQKEIVNIE
jgi:hypothetical protein